MAYYATSQPNNNTQFEFCNSGRLSDVTYLYPCLDGNKVLSTSGYSNKKSNLKIPPASYIISDSGNYVGSYASNLGIAGNVGNEFNDVVLGNYYIYSKDNCKFIRECSDMGPNVSKEMCGNFWANSEVYCLYEDRGVFVSDILFLLMSVVAIILVVIILLAFYPEMKKAFYTERVRVYNGNTYV